MINILKLIVNCFYRLNLVKILLSWKSHAFLFVFQSIYTEYLLLNMHFFLKLTRISLFSPYTHSKCQITLLIRCIYSSVIIEVSFLQERRELTYTINYTSMFIQALSSKVFNRKVQICISHSWCRWLFFNLILLTISQNSVNFLSVCRLRRWKH